MIRTKNNIFDYKYTSPGNGTFFGDYKNGTVKKTSLLGAIKEELENNNSGKAENVYSETPKSNFININNTNSNSIIKGTDTTPVLPKITANTNTPQKQGGLIKNNIKSVLSHIYGEPDTKHLFDDIDDEDVEKNIPMAESAIQTNIDRGNLSKDALAKLPNLRDGMTLFYAASDKGNNRAATKAREAAYTKWESPLLKEVERSLKATKKTNSDVKSDHKGSEKENSFWDVTSTVLSAASLIPGVDTFTNLASIPVDLIRGDYLSAGLDALGVIPLVGEIGDAAKVVRKADDIADVVKVAKKTDDVKDVIKAGEGANESLKISKNTTTFSNFPKTIHEGKQGKHIVGHNNYKKGKSVLENSFETTQNLVNEFSGTGQKIGANRERVNFNRIIGKYVDPKTGLAYDTTVGIIHYSNSGTHIVPDKPVNWRK